MYRGIDKMLRFYNGANRYIKWIHADNQFRAILAPIEDDFEGVNMNIYNAGEHVKEAERNNRVVQERF